MFQAILVAIDIVILIAVCLALAVLDTYLKEMRDLVYNSVIAKQPPMKLLQSPPKEMVRSSDSKVCTHSSGVYTEMDLERNRNERCVDCRSILRTIKQN